MISYIQKLLEIKMEVELDFFVNFKIDFLRNNASNAMSKFTQKIMSCNLLLHLTVYAGFLHEKN